MKSIKITDTAAITAALDEVNGKATAHTFTTAWEINACAEDAESKLYLLGIPKKDRAGAQYVVQSGSRLPNAYKHGAITTVVTLSRNNSGWKVEKISQATLYPNCTPRKLLLLTPVQDAIAISNLRKCYSVQS